MASSPAVAMASFSASLVSCWAGVFVFFLGVVMFNMEAHSIFLRL